MNDSQFEPLPIIHFDDYPEMQDRKWKRCSHAETKAVMWMSLGIGFAFGMFLTGFIVTSILM